MARILGVGCDRMVAVRHHHCSDELRCVMTCKAYQASDQMICQCGLQWDMNDPDPPECTSDKLDMVKKHITRIEMSGSPNGRNKTTYDNLRIKRVELEGLLRE